MTFNYIHGCGNSFLECLRFSFITYHLCCCYHDESVGNNTPMTSLVPSLIKLRCLFCSEQTYVSVKGLTVIVIYSTVVKDLTTSGIKLVNLLPSSYIDNNCSSATLSQPFHMFFLNILLSLLRIAQPFSFCLIQDSDYTDIAA